MKIPLIGSATALAATAAVFAVGLQRPADSAPLPVAAGPPVPTHVWALGRVEPREDVVRLYGPADAVVVVDGLEAEEGDEVEAGQVLARLEGRELALADLESAKARYRRARSDLERADGLHDQNVLSSASLEAREIDHRVARAELARADALVERTLVRAPTPGRVIDIHTRPGERVEREGILEMAPLDDMVVVAEVHETDVSRLAVGDEAKVTSPALAQPLSGRVTHIARKIGMADVLDTDPASKADARVVEVEIALDEDEAASHFVHLQVDVAFSPNAGAE